MTKTMMNQEWAMGLDEMIESEAQAQAICMATERFPPRIRSVRRQAQAGVRGRLSHARPGEAHGRATGIDWPFFEPRHRALAERLDAFVGSPVHGRDRP